MLWIDVKYANLLSVQLENYSVKQQNPYLANFRCPLCGDSQKSKKKSRGYFYTKTSSLFYKCHNCGAGTTLGNLIKNISETLYKQYRLERYKEGLDIGNAAKPHSRIFPVEFSNFTPVFAEKSPLDRLFDKVNMLPDHNPGVRYLKSRQIPRDKWNDIYFAFETKKLIELCPDYHEIIKYEEPRIILPFFNRNGSLIGITARDLKNGKLRYLTLKIDKDEIMIYNLNNIDTSKRVYCVEGPLDSLFLDNSVAVGSSDLSKISNILRKDNTTLIFDNQPRNSSIIKLMKKAMEDQWSITIWPENLKEKDINDMVINGKSSSEIMKIINMNTHSGLSLRLKFKTWSKC